METFWIEFKAQVLLLLNTDRTTIQTRKWKYFAYFLHFQANLYLRFMLPLIFCLPVIIMPLPDLEVLRACPEGKAESGRNRNTHAILLTNLPVFLFRCFKFVGLVGW